MAKISPVFSGIKVEEGYEVAATRKGVALKTGLLLLIAILVGVFAPIGLVKAVSADKFLYIVIAALVVALITAIVGQIFPKTSMICSLIYAPCEGLVLGLVSYSFEFEFNGIVLTAIGLTALLFSVTLLLYATGIVKVTNRFLFMGVAFFLTAFLGILIFWIVTMINPNSLLAMSYNTFKAILIIISAIVLLYGAFMLTLDFAQIDSLVAGGFDKRYEWSAALGLMITIVYIYIEFLRLLAIIMSKKD